MIYVDDFEKGYNELGFILYLGETGRKVRKLKIKQARK